MTSETTYIDIVTNKRIIFAGTMIIEGRKISVSLCTVELLPTDKGTGLLFTHQAAFFEGSDGPEMRKDGWEKLLSNLSTELAR